MSPFTPRDTVSSPPAGVELNALPPGHVLRSTLRICAGLLVVILGMLACTLALFTAVTPDRFTFLGRSHSCLRSHHVMPCPYPPPASH